MNRSSENQFMRNVTFLRFLIAFSIPCTVHLITAEKAQALFEFWKSGFPSATVSGLKWVSDGSVSTPYRINYVEPAAQSWNGITPKVNLAKATGTTYDVKFYVSVGTVQSRDALTIPYCASGTFSACVETSTLYQGGTSPTPTAWTKIHMQIYDNIMTARSYNADQRTRVIIDELGHTLSMRHNPDESTVATASLPTIMSPTLNQFSQLSNLDRTNLKSKWGQ
jgi:hypothetical protein